MPTYYGMHDAPGGRQSMDCFQRPDGTPLQPGDMKSYLTPWGLLNPFLEELMHDEGFIVDGEYTQTPDYEKLKELLERNKRHLKSNPTLEKWFTNGDKLISSKIRLTQAYNVISMKPGDKVYVRGKKKIINEGWLFEVVNNDIEYKFINGKYWPSIKFKTLGKVSNQDYLKIHAQPSSFWTINNPDEQAFLAELL